MKKSSLLPLVLLTASTIANAASSFDLDSIRPYAGFDAQARIMEFGKENGANIFQKHSPQGNIFVGLKFNDYLGVEAGCEASVKTHRSVRLQPGQFAVGGAPVSPLEGFRDMQSTTQMVTPHLNLMGYLPISNCSNLQLIGTVGIARPRVTLTSRFIRDNSGPQDINRTFVATKTVLRAGAGVQYMFTEYAGMRGMVIFENTAKFNNILRRETAAARSIIAKVKNSFNLGLGVFVSF